MILPDPLIFSRPLHVWLGILLFLVLIFQIMIGKKWIKIPFWIHTRINPIILFILTLIHGFYGFQTYFLR